MVDHPPLVVADHLSSDYIDKPVSVKAKLMFDGIAGRESSLRGRSIPHL
jgi:hypothetical protein